MAQNEKGYRATFWWRAGLGSPVAECACFFLHLSVSLQQPCWNPTGWKDGQLVAANYNSQCLCFWLGSASGNEPPVGDVAGLEDGPMGDAKMFPHSVLSLI